MLSLKGSDPYETRPGTVQGMTKTNDAMRRGPTNFEQVPLDVVKKIAEVDAPLNDNAATEEPGDAPTPAKTTGRSIPRRPTHPNKR
jgi:hypothetical protein